AQELIKTAEQKFAGKPGQVMFMVKNDASNDHSQFIPMNSNNEADWLKLHQQATSDIVVAHSWFRTLSGLDYTSGFSAERILQEYEVALNTIILAEQEELLEPLRKIIRDILECDDSSLEIVNRPPTSARPDYIKVWEARRADGLDFNPEDADQNLFLAQLKYKNQ
ncbi:MAG: phage portal protein, partial [Rikenellaceae bacterium]|nr:phage portal protein [Rikenellaceae bacterium]